MKAHFAHSDPERPEVEWHRLREHLESTARRAEEFASSYAKGWGSLAGLWHDIGKYQRGFQEYLRAHGDHTRTPHSGAGALLAMEKRERPRWHSRSPDRLQRECPAGRDLANRESAGKQWIC